MKNLKQISGNELSELLDLLGNINHVIDQYSHVKDLLPKSLITTINSYSQKLIQENERREDEF